MDMVGTLSAAYTSMALHPGGKSLALDASGDLVLVGGADGSAGIHSISQNKQLHALEGAKGQITDTVWWDSRVIISTSSGQILIFEDGSRMASLGVHAGSTTAMALHPSGEILGSVGEDRSFAFYDLSTLKPVMHVHGESGRFYHSRSSKTSIGMLTAPIRIHHGSLPPRRASLRGRDIWRADQDLRRTHGGQRGDVRLGGLHLISILFRERDVARERVRRPKPGHDLESAHRLAAEGYRGRRSCRQRALGLYGAVPRHGWLQRRHGAGVP